MVCFTNRYGDLRYIPILNLKSYNIMKKLREKII